MDYLDICSAEEAVKFSDGNRKFYEEQLLKEVRAEEFKECKKIKESIIAGIKNSGYFVVVPEIKFEENRKRLLDLGYKLEDIVELNGALLCTHKRVGFLKLREVFTRTTQIPEHKKTKISWGENNDISKMDKH